MGNLYENPLQIIDSNKILETINYLKEIFYQMKEKYGEIKTKREQSKYEKEAKKILDLMEEIEEMMDINPLFTEIELFDFVDIKEMASYILKDSSLFEKHFNFMLEFLKDYNQIIFLKFNTENIPNESSYEEEYEKFKEKFFRKRGFFYTHIYEHLGIYDDLLDETVNILWRDWD